MKHFSPEYRRSIESSLTGFLRKGGDDVVCIGYFKCKGGQCKMCGKVSIENRYVLENLRSHCWLIVGSECVENYQVILSEWGYQPEFIVFPEALRNHAKWILRGNRHAIVFDDGIVMRSQVDCETIVQNDCRPIILETGTFVRVEDTPEGNKALTAWALGTEDPILEEEEDRWDLCGCGGKLWHCEDCDNEMCSECGSGCICEDRPGFDYHAGVDDEAEPE